MIEFSPKLAFWSNWLLIASIVFALQSISWVFIGSFDPWGIYDAWIANALFANDSLSMNQNELFRFGVGLLGATSCAFFVLFAFITKFAFSIGQQWAHAALATGILTWFIIDSAFSVAMNAYFNVYVVNLPCLLIVAIPLLATTGQFYAKRSAE